MTSKDDWDKPHISIAMPDGSTCRVYFPFKVYTTDDRSGDIVRFSWSGVNRINEAIQDHLKRQRTDSQRKPNFLMRSIE